MSTFPDTEVEKASFLGQALVGGATETVVLIVDDLNKRYGIGFRDGNSVPQFIIEIIVFYMHLVDHLAFVHLGSARRELFADRFIVAVVKEFLQEMSRDLSANALGEALRDTYNSRQMQYAVYRALAPGKTEPPKDTLYWAFSKILFDFFDDSKDVRRMTESVVWHPFDKPDISAC